MSRLRVWRARSVRGLAGVHVDWGNESMCVRLYKEVGKGLTLERGREG